MKNRYRLKIAIIACFTATALIGGSSSLAQKAQVETAGQRFKSIKVLNDMPADQMGKVMNMMSASLGVDCKFCHSSNDGDYEKEGNEHKDTARQMIKMVFDLNKTQFNNRPEINCNSCHNGRSHPQPSFPLTAPVPQLPRPIQPDKRPTADDIVAKHIAAVGGAENLAKVTSRRIKSMRVEPDGKTIWPETIWLKGNKYSADLLYGTYLVREVFDGTTARKFGGGSAIELKADEMEQIKREGEMFSSANLKLTFPKMEFRSIDRIDGKEVYFIIGTTARNVRERLYFDVATNLLIRRAISTPTVFGGFVYQVDYADYKDFAGVKLPTTFHYAVPHIRWTRKISEVKTNVPVEDSKFAAPSEK